MNEKPLERANRIARNLGFTLSAHPGWESAVADMIEAAVREERQRIAELERDREVGWGWLDAFRAEVAARETENTAKVP